MVVLEGLENLGEISIQVGRKRVSYALHITRPVAKRVYIFLYKNLQLIIRMELLHSLTYLPPVLE